jgi:hypothetical protein
LAQHASCGLGRRPPVFIIAALSVGPDDLGFGDGDGSGVGFGVEGSVDGTYEIGEGGGEISISLETASTGCARMGNMVNNAFGKEKAIGVSVEGSGLW